MRRRTYLAAVGAGTALLAGCPAFEPEPDPEPEPKAEPMPKPEPPTPRPTETPDEPAFEAFEEEVDMVEEMGCDPTGVEPCDDAIRDAIADDTLLVFPEGEYRFDSRVSSRETGFERVGFSGSGDVQFLAPTGFNHRLVTVADVGEVVFRGIDIDITEDDTTAGLQFDARNRLLVEDVEFLGRGTHPDQNVTFALLPAIREENGRGVVRNVVATEGSGLGNYKGGEGRGAIWIGLTNHGTISIEDCHFEEFGNNAIYASRTPGNVEVRGGTFRNNNVASVRISGDGSFVEGATIEVDTDQYTGPSTHNDQKVNTRGIVIERGSIEKEPGAQIHDCDVQILKTQFPGAAIDVWPTGQTLSMTNTRIEMNVASAALHRAPKELQGNVHEPSEAARWLQLSDVTITGSGSGWEAIRIVDGSYSQIQNCRIEQTGSDRRGIRLVRSTGLQLDGGSIRTTGYPLLIELDEPVLTDCLVQIETPPQVELPAVDDADDGSTQQLSRTDRTIETDCIDLELIQQFGGSPPTTVGITDFQEEGGIVFSAQERSE